MSNRRIALYLLPFVPITLVTAALMQFFGNPFDPIDSGWKPVSGKHVGHKRDDVERRLGKPPHGWIGHYGNPPDSYTQAHDPAISVIYTCPAGNLYLSYEHVDGEWICFSSDWMPNGAVF